MVPYNLFSASLRSSSIVLILVVVDDGPVPYGHSKLISGEKVLILVVVDDGPVQPEKLKDAVKEVS